MNGTTLALASLQQAGRSPQLPLAVDLQGEELILASLLRVLPGQRYVGRALWRGQPVLAKLLVGERARRHWQREVDGAHRLQQSGLRTPALLAEGFAEGQGGWLLFEFLEQADSLWQCWQRATDAAQRQAVLLQALQAVAGMHAAGLRQSDLHLDNLLLQDGQLYLIDGAAVEGQADHPLDAGQCADNLGMLLAQLPVRVEDDLEPLLAHYQACGGLRLSADAVRAACERVRRWRLKDYMKKIGRDCSLFSARNTAGGLRVVRRERAAELQALLDDPDAAIASGKLLKDGGSATVALVQVAGRPLLVKRYNLKNFLHRLKRCWRPTRAWHSWQEGNRLQLLGIATPQPLAVIESRCCWLRGRSWLITEYLPGQDIISRFAPHVNGAPPEEELAALDRLFAALCRERISHGDFKGTNLFWQDGQWMLIDLDALQQHGSEQGFLRAHARDRARFLRNWPQDSALYRLLDARIPQAGQS